jgi:hypothetical protein
MSTNAGGRPRKVPKLLEKYDLEGYGEELCDMWSRETNRYSVRELEVKFNGRLIQAAAETHGSDIDAMTAEEYYRNLDSDETDETKKQRIRDRLGAFGVDVDALEADFVSYHGVYTYLRSRGATPGGESDTDEPETLIQSALDTVEDTRETAGSELTPELKRLSNAGVIPETPPEPHVTIKLTCAYCGAVHPLRRYLTQQGCGCENEPTPPLFGELEGGDGDELSALLKDGLLQE